MVKEAFYFIEFVNPRSDWEIEIHHEWGCSLSIPEVIGKLKYIMNGVAHGLGEGLKKIPRGVKKSTQFVKFPPSPSPPLENPYLRPCGPSLHRYSHAIDSLIFQKILLKSIILFIILTSSHTLCQLISYYIGLIFDRSFSNKQ